MNIHQLRIAQSTSVNSLSDTLKTVELNITELCNRTCSFCPRHNPSTYPNRKIMMPLDIVRKVADDLSSIGFNNRVSIVGFGEPFLNPKLVDIIQIISESLPELKWLEVNTNGDFITRDRVAALSNAGLNQLTVSMYDKDISDAISEQLKGIDIQLTFKHFYSEKMELIEVNRDNILTQINIVNKKTSCYVPFYKMFIDYDGNVLICNNDWGRQGIVGNVMEKHLLEIWNDDSLTNYRLQLMNKDRNMQPCTFCDIDGTIFGVDSFKFYENHFNREI